MVVINWHHKVYLHCQCIVVFLLEMNFDHEAVFNNKKNITISMVVCISTLILLIKKQVTLGIKINRKKKLVSCFFSFTMM